MTQENQNKGSWQSIRKEAISRDGGVCRFCDISNEEHKDEYGYALSVHHIIPKSDGGSNELDNLITVCRSCHKTIQHTQASAFAELADDSSPETDSEDEDDAADEGDEVDEGDKWEFENAAQALQEAKSIIKETAEESSQTDTEPKVGTDEMPVVGKQERGEMLLALTASEFRKLVQGEVPPELADTVVNDLMKESGLPSCK